MSASPLHLEPKATNGRNRLLEGPVNVETGGRLSGLLFELGVEPSLTVKEAAAILRWSHWRARRYFREVDGICISYRPKRYKRPYRAFTIPLSVFAREWRKMTGQEPEATVIIRQRLASMMGK